jgi:hypothetical protein
MPNVSRSIHASENRLAVIELAEELQIRKQTIFKVAKRLGIQTNWRKESARGGQRIATVSQAEATLIRNELRRTRSSTTDDQNVSLPALLSDEVGVFYIIQLEPNHDSGRFKVGFTTDLDDRIRKHRCSTPFAQCLKNWPCRRRWERAAIDCVTNGCERLHTEVFRTTSINDVIGRSNEFFQLMPAL